jgi:hypothetical protein
VGYSYPGCLSSQRAHRVKLCPRSGENFPFDVERLGTADLAGSGIHLRLSSDAGSMTRQVLVEAFLNSSQGDSVTEHVRFRGVPANILGSHFSGNAYPLEERTSCGFIRSPLGDKHPAWPRCRQSELSDTVRKLGLQSAAIPSHLAVVLSFLRIPTPCSRCDSLLSEVVFRAGLSRGRVGGAPCS